MVKAVKFHYTPTEGMLGLLETFRAMVNEASRIGFEKKPRTRFQLITMVYPEFKERFGLLTHYILSACECAFAMLRNRRWKKCPYAEHLFLKLDNQTYQLDYMLLRIPTTPRNILSRFKESSLVHSVNEGLANVGMVLREATTRS